MRNMPKTDNSMAWVCIPRYPHTNQAIASNRASSSGGDQQAPALEPALGLPLTPPPEVQHDAGRIGHDPNGIAFIEDLVQEATAQLVVVKMHSSTASLRNESDSLKILHDVNGSEDYIGAWIMREVHSSISTLSWLSLRPIFGKTLDAFGQTCLTTNRIPTYFVWHIAASLISALEFAHKAGIAHGAVRGANAMLRCLRPSGQQYQDWPDVVLTEFGAARRLPRYEDTGNTDASANLKSKDIMNLVTMLYEDVISQWSDASLLMDFVDLSIEQTDPFMQFAVALKGLLEAGLQGIKFNFGDLKDWREMAVGERTKGPESCPYWIQRAAHDTLITEEELSKAIRAPLVLKFGQDSKQYKQWERARRTPVALCKREAKCGLLVIRFSLRREEFMNIAERG